MSDTPVATTEQVSITRTIDASREDVFKAWTDPTQVAAWFGPAQMNTPKEGIRIDLRVGGRYELTMVGGGREFTIGYTITELDEPSLLEMRSDPMPEMGMHEPTIVRVELHDEDGKTRMVFSDGPFPSGGSQHAGAGWNAAFDKLATHLGG